MAYYLQGIQFYKSEYITPQHLGHLASLSSSPNLLHPKADSDRRAESNNNLNHQEAQIKAANRKVSL